MAHFYNTIDQQMIPSQQAMMLESALAFERLVKSPKTGKPGPNGNVHVTWDNPTEVENYIKKLQTAADRLSTENRKLRKKHIIMGEKVKSVSSAFSALLVFRKLQNVNCRMLFFDESLRI